MTEQLTFENEYEEYKAFVDKFKRKPTKDDCFTPENIYNAISDYVCRKHGINHNCIVRPFWPGGDYECFDYPEGCVVLDNPPFSIFSKIVRFYVDKGIKFFLFGPGMNVMHIAGILKGKVTAVITGNSIEYKNHVTVSTCFCHNLYDDGIMVESEPELYRIILNENTKSRKNKNVSVNALDIPDCTITASKIKELSSHDVIYKLKSCDCYYKDTFDNYEKHLFGGMAILSDKATKEYKAAKEKADSYVNISKITLSKREQDIQGLIS